MISWTTRLCAATLGLLCLMPAAMGAEDAAKEHGPIAWTESLPAAMKTAAKEKKIIFLDFWAPWCGPCKRMLKTTYQNKEVVERSKQFVPVLINTDAQPELTKKFGISTIPAVIFLDAKGNVLKKPEPQYLDAKALLKVMSDVAKKGKG